MTNDSWKGGLWVLALLAGLEVLGPLLAAPYIPLVDPDEGKHAAIAQEMVESGDWIVPRLLHEPFLDKPILYFWAVAASLKIFGMSEAAVRLPGLLFGMFGTLTTAAVAWRLLGRRTGLIAGVFYASMILPLVMVQLPAHDVALVTWVNLALLCLWEADLRRMEFSPPAGRRPNAICPTPGLVLDCVGRRGAGTGHLDQGARRRGLGGNCFRGISPRFQAAAVHPLLPCGTGLDRGGIHRLVVVRCRGTRPSGLPALLFLRSPRAWFPHGVAAAWPGAVVVLLPDPDRRRDSLGRIPAGARARRRQPLAERNVGEDRQRIRHIRVPVQDGTRSVPDTMSRPLLLLVCWLVGCTLFLTLSRSKLGTYIWPVFLDPELVVDKAPDASNSRTGYHVALGFGQAMNVVNASEPKAGLNFDQYLKEAYFSYLAPVGKGLQVDVGKFVTPNGAEVIETKDNWNYSRSLLFTYAIPYFHFGMRAKYAFNDKYSLTGFFVNGWNNVLDNNTGKTNGNEFCLESQ